MRSRQIAPGIAAFVAAILVALIGLGAWAEATPNLTSGSGPRGVAELRLLGVNDLHGHLEPPRPGIGGAAWLDAHLDRATIPGRTIRVHAGDMVGASPLVSSWFHDEPSIEASNRIGFDVGTLGNHEFDEGGDELLRLLRGGQRTGPEALERDADGTLVNTSAPDFGGADYPYIGANTYDQDGEPLLPPYEIVERAGVRVGFIGVTTESTPHFLLPRHSERFRFTDISEAVDRWVPVLRRQGVEAIVVLAHSGGKTDPGDSTSAAGEILDEAAEMSDAVDVVIAGHSHSLLNLRVPNASGDGDKLVVEALSYGIAYDQVDMTVDLATGDVVEKSADVPSTAHSGVEPDADTAAHVAAHVDRVAPLAKRVLGRSTVPLTRANGDLGQLAADAQLAFADADVAVVNGGSLRADLAAGPLTYEELFAVHPYDFDLLRVKLRGRDLTRLLEGPGSSQLYVAGRRPPYEPDALYSVVANELIATGHAFPILRDGARGGRVIGTEVEALAVFVARR
jgi:5'-nucleotidase